MSRVLTVRSLGIQDYAKTVQQLRDFTCQRVAKTPDQIWLLQHLPVFSQGQSGRSEHILNTGNIPVVQSDRGGQVTYHGPGQLIVYFLVDIARKKMGVRTLINLIEKSVIELLKSYGINSNSNPKAPGIYIAEKKICSIGLRVRKGRTYHGISLNVDMDLEPFSRINPCGHANMQMTQLSHYVQNINMDATIEKLLPIIAENLDYAENN